MLIQCTKKLLDQLKVKPLSLPEERKIFSWHANLIMVNRRKTVVLVNDQNRYVIVLYGMVAKDFTKINDLIPEAIRRVYREEGIKEEVIDFYLEQAGEINYNKTKDSTSVARMNKSVETVYFFNDLLDNENIVQVPICLKAGRFLVGNGNKAYIHPIEELNKDLEELVGYPIISTQAVQIKISLNLESFDVWRRLVVPTKLSFNQFHKVIQTSFGWKNYHLHEFYIYNHLKPILKNQEWSANHPLYHPNGYKPILNIVCDEEAFNYGKEGIPMKHEGGVKLSDFLPKHKELRYNYDFGDNWQHDITIEKFLDDYDKNYPVCIDGEGNTPPEDVGGEYGYEEFLKIIADESHPDNMHIVSWGKMQGYSDFDIMTVNRFLKSLFD
jgi:hypothetical protein